MTDHRFLPGTVVRHVGLGVQATIAAHCAHPVSQAGAWYTIQWFDGATPHEAAVPDCDLEEVAKP